MSSSISSGQFCGDGIISNSEQCDGSDLNAQTCQSLGFESGSLNCSAVCRFDTAQCIVSADTLWVDGSLGADCATYSPASRNCGAGDAQAFRTIQAAANAVRPSQTVLVRAGIYREIVNIRQNGLADARITFKSFPGDYPQRATIDAERRRTNGIRIAADRNNGCSAGNYNTIEGFVVKNSIAGSGSGNIVIQGAEGAIIRGNRITNDNWQGDDYAPGIHFSGATKDLVIEENHISYTKSGIEGRWSPSGNCPGEPDGTIIRFNHVHHIHVNDFLQQNHSYCIAVANGTKNNIIEHNLAHHCSDFAIGTNETFGPTKIARNIVYGSDYANGGGGGNGIKVKPLANTDSITRFYRDEVLYNIAFLNRGEGIHLIEYPNQWGADAFNNTSVLNAEGVSYRPRSSPPEYAYRVFNNALAFNLNRDIPFNAGTFGPPAELFDYNLLRIRYHSPQQGGELHTFAGTLSSPLNPHFTDINILTNLPDEEGTPLLLRPLSATEQRPMPDGFNGFQSARQAIEYAWTVIGSALAPRPNSPLIDAGKELAIGNLDAVTNLINDAPDVADPWTDDGQLGVRDIGAIEYQP